MEAAKMWKGRRCAPLLGDLGWQSCRARWQGPGPAWVRVLSGCWAGLSSRATAGAVEHLHHRVDHFARRGHLGGPTVTNLGNDLNTVTVIHRMRTAWPIRARSSLVARG